MYFINKMHLFKVDSRWCKFLSSIIFLMAGYSIFGHSLPMMGISWKKSILSYLAKIFRGKKRMEIENWWNDFWGDEMNIGMIARRKQYSMDICVYLHRFWGLAHWFRFIKHRQTQVYLLSYRCIFSSFFINCYMHASIHWGYKSFYPFQTCVSIT